MAVAHLQGENGRGQMHGLMQRRDDVQTTEAGSRWMACPKPSTLVAVTRGGTHPCPGPRPPQAQQGQAKGHQRHQQAGIHLHADMCCWGQREALVHACSLLG